MMDQIEVGRIILVNGPSFSGKTYFISKLFDFIPDCKIVNFERYFKQGSYSGFYEEIYKLYKSGHVVIGESVNNYYGHSSFPDYFNNVSMLNIAVLPSYKDHLKNYNRFLSMFGSSMTRKRAGYQDVSGLRSKTVMPIKCDVRIFNGRNFNEIKKVVINYVTKNVKNNNS